MHAEYHEWFHRVDDHNELRQGEAAMADVWGTRDWADRHFAEGLGLWEVNVYKAAVEFQGVTYHHSEFRKRLALAFLTLGKHTWGEPLAAPAPESPAQPGPSCEHKFTTFEKLTGKRAEGHVCGYCGQKGYLLCTSCFPDVQHAGYAICNPTTGRDCLVQHLRGVAPEHSMHTHAKSSDASRRDGLRDTPAASHKKAQARTAAQAGGKATQASKRTKARR
jgi:hypothetical protein